ncbi:MAG: rRNA pseudouridine synthase [Oscillospiraceae bacterium]|nr:rRNA pseudouridine synthase [Oscillospiraceae bacterium]
MKERIQKILSARGVASRRRAEGLIAAGRISCNSVICSLGDSADADLDEICLDGKPIPSKQEYVYILLHKPRGYVTTLSDEKGRKNVAQLVAECNRRVYPVGRLDMDSEGLLLLTDDGNFANRLTHPSHEINKTYRVWVRGYCELAMKQVKKPITLDGYTIAKPTVKLISHSSDGDAQLEITIHEGRNRQVRRMCAAAGMIVKRLVRISEGDIKLGNLSPGSWRYLTQEEISLLNK